MLDFTPWTAEQNDLLRKMIAQGRTRTQISQVIGKTPTAVAARRRRIGLTSKKWPNKWNGELIAELRDLWVNQKWSALRCATYLSEKYSHLVTRNAIIGKVHRLNIGRPNCHEPKVKLPRQPKKARTPRQYVFKKHREYLKLIYSTPAPTGPSVSFAELKEKHCRYIAGEPNALETQYCGAPVSYRSLCDYHAQICYQRDAVRSLPASLGSAPTLPSPDLAVGAEPPFLGFSA